MTAHPLPRVAAAGGNLPAARHAAESPALLRMPQEQLAAREVVQRLRAHIARMEETTHRLEPKRGWQDRAARDAPVWRFGVAEVDAHLSPQGLARHALHDIAPAQYGDTPAAMGFALALAVQRSKTEFQARPVLWCRLNIENLEHGMIYGHGLEQLGLRREKLLTLSLKHQVSLFWTMEEALKSGCFSAVISDVAAQYIDLTITRRLNISAGEGKSAGLIVFNRYYQDNTASFSRWQVATAASPRPAWDASAPGTPAWAVTLSRIRSGRPGHWTLSWNTPSSSFTHASHHFSLVSGISGGAFSAGAAQAAPAPAAQGPALRAG